MMRPSDNPPLPEADELLVNGYLDGELEPDAQQAFELRLAREPELRAALKRLEALRHVLRARVTGLTASEAFRARISRVGAPAIPSAGAPTAQSPTTEWRSARFDWRMMAASVILSFGIGTAATYLLTARPAQPAARPALVAVHQRVLLAARPVEMASSDRHTVKPWFDAKLAISPPVSDLAADGFPLVGGRIDLVGENRVPVLVYRRGPHLISVVAVPDAGGSDLGLPARRATRDGYTVLTWRGADFDFSAISDVADRDLVTFVHKLRRTMRTR